VKHRVVFETRNGHLGYLQPVNTSGYQQIGVATKTFVESISGLTAGKNQREVKKAGSPKNLGAQDRPN